VLPIPRLSSVVVIPIPHPIPSVQPRLQPPSEVTQVVRYSATSLSPQLLHCLATPLQRLREAHCLAAPRSINRLRRIASEVQAAICLGEQQLRSLVGYLVPPRLRPSVSPTLRQLQIHLGPRQRLHLDSKRNNKMLARLGFPDLDNNHNNNRTKPLAPMPLVEMRLDSKINRIRILLGDQPSLRSSVNSSLVMLSPIPNSLVGACSAASNSNNKNRRSKVSLATLLDSETHRIKAQVCSATTRRSHQSQACLEILSSSSLGEVCLETLLRIRADPLSLAIPARTNNSKDLRSLGREIVRAYSRIPSSSSKTP
jgi:hypothetical protein